MQRPSRKPVETSAQTTPPDNDPERLVVRPKQVTLPEHGLVVFESRHGPGFFGELKNSYSKFHLVIHGRAYWDVAGRRYATMPGMLFHIAAGVPHRIRDVPLAPVTNYVVHYQPHLLDKELTERLAAPPGIVLLNLRRPDLHQAAPIRSLFREMLFESDARQLGWKVILKSRLIDLAVRTLRIAERQNRRTLVFKAGSDSMERVAHYALHLKSRLFRPETLADAAKSVHLSRRQFTDLFRRVTGKSRRRYIRTLRLEHVVRLLINTDKSVIAVAFEAGFEDLSQFHHIFKKAYGCTPSNYREMHQRQSRPGAGSPSHGQ
ncbi:MAG: AraC family transcriptional regulator [Verrucomicrobiota bacterium]|jgi:AraC-like DNA-binding protein/mannose-6-phosphate isomerase-like protein (cupin superfamily)